MSSAISSGYNPLRWRCDTQGCFNTKCRPKIEVFCKCFPGAISFGDIDGIVEINGYTLTLEWKGFRGALPTGQRIMHSRTTFYGNNSVICLCGDPESMRVEAVAYFYQGQWLEWQTATLDDAKDIITSWAQWAKQQPPFMTLRAVIPMLLRMHKKDDLIAAIKNA